MRNLGYQARAHIDGNYQVRCPQLARDAGLGEIGRMSLLMTPKLGPRVRIAAVTTTAPLVHSLKTSGRGILEFCQICKKCADNCPPQALSTANRESIKGELLWPMSQERCFNYWCQVGTDCGRCMSVCPYSHPNNHFHNLIRFLIAWAPVFRRLAIHLDHFLYGKRPIQKRKNAYL